MYRIWVVNTLSLLFLWYSLCLSVWPPCLLSIKTAVLLIWLKNSMHSTIKTKMFGHRSFSHAAPSVWNSLPHEIRHIQSATALKTAWKTHLFKSYLCWVNLYSLHLFCELPHLTCCGVCVRAYVCACVCVCVCYVCERGRERKGGERDRERERCRLYLLVYCPWMTL